jgi:DNA processing protein
MNRLEALIGLNLSGGIGSIRLKRLLDYFGRPEDVFKSPVDKLSAVCGISLNLARKIYSVDARAIEREIILAKKNNFKILTLEDSEYPLNLKNTFDPPFLLYVKGEIKKEDSLSLAIVGSRRASFYGLSCAEKFSADLSGRGLTIISGMARGIDSCAHRAALKQGARTIAVMGSGLNHIYPPENRKLAQEIADNGAVISEFPLDTLPLRQNFPQRNRVISGLAIGVLVVEAARNSGALITADFALEQGREVFAIPGKVDSEASFGTNTLIQQGAKLVSCSEDILEELNLSITKNRPSEQFQTDSCYPALDGAEKSLYNLISLVPLSIDEIMQRSSMSIPQISDILLHLELKKLIRQLPGKHFVRN